MFQEAWKGGNRQKRYGEASIDRRNNHEEGEQKQKGQYRKNKETRQGKKTLLEIKKSRNCRTDIR